MILNRFLVVLAATAAAAPAVASEGHFDVFLGRPTSGNQTVFGGIDVDDADITLGERVFEAEMGENPLDGTFDTDEPGFNHPADDAALPAGVASLLQGDAIAVSALSLEVDGVVAPLFYWNGVGPVSFAPAVGTIFSVLDGNPIGQAGADGGFDDHPIFSLDDGDGLNSTAPPVGIYLASIEASVADLASTGPLYLVLGTEGLITEGDLGLTQAELDLLTELEIDELLDGALEEVVEMGVEYVEANVVIPEPAAALLAAVAAVGFINRRNGIASR